MREDHMALRSVAVVLIEPVALFEFGVAAEVFGIDRTEDGVPPFDYRVCTADPTRPVRSGGTAPVGISVDHGLAALKGVDLVVVPATTARDYPEELLQGLRDAHAAGATLLTVCSGVFVLAAAGLLHGRAATCHWKSLDELNQRHPDLTLEPNKLFVDSGSIITSAGTAAGIDACLHLVRRELGSEVANRIARRMVVPPQRDGGQQQFVETPVPQHDADRLAPLLDWATANLAEEHTVTTLAARALMSPRTFARRFVAEVGITPHQWLLRQRILRARHLLEQSVEPVDRIAELVGFGSAAVLRQHFRRETGLAPGDYRKRFGTVVEEPGTQANSWSSSPGVLATATVSASSPGAAYPH
jgi:AraC family transcriptional activator FtrA